MDSYADTVILEVFAQKMITKTVMRSNEDRAPRKQNYCYKGHYLLSLHYQLTLPHADIMLFVRKSLL